MKVITKKSSYAIWRKVKFLLYVFAFLCLVHVLESCQEQTTPSNLSVEKNELFSFVIDSPIVMQNQLHLLSVRKNDEVIRIRQYDSWGLFGLICSVYSGSNKRIELIRQVPFSSVDGEICYQFLQKELSSTTLKEIEEMYEKLKIKDYPIDLEPNRNLIDGGLFSIARKHEKFLNCTTWQLMSFDERDSIYFQEKKNAISFYNKILSLTDYPKPKLIGIIDTISNDSFKYLISLDDYTMVKSVAYGYGKWRFEPKYDVYQPATLYCQFSDSTDYADAISATVEYFNQNTIVVKGCEIRNR